jgi:site-specific DNA recombinase
MDAVIYTRVSRGSAGGRSVEDQERECRQECERNGWPVRAVYATTRSGPRATPRASAADGRPMSRPPRGYLATSEIDAQGRHRPQWEPDPVEAPRVGEAVERLLAGETQYSVLEWLKATEGYAPTTPTTLRRALLNPALAGLRQHQGEVVGKASWPAIITKEQHEQLKSRDRRMRAMYGYNSQPGPEPMYLLSGIAKCGVCGDGLRYRAKQGRKPFYACQKGHVSRLADMLDKAVEAEIFKRLSGVDPSDYESDDADDSAVIAEIEELERQLAEWEAEAIAGQVSPGAFGRAERDLTARIGALRAKIETPSELELDPAQWPELTMAERRHTVRSLFEVVVPQLPVSHSPASNGSPSENFIGPSIVIPVFIDTRHGPRNRLGFIGVQAGVGCGPCAAVP